MIQFENPIFAESAVNMLNKSKFDMSSEGIDLSFSRHQEIAGGPVFTLFFKKKTILYHSINSFIHFHSKSKSDTLADYTGSMMNRYVGKPAQRPFTPGCILYFFNIAPDATEEEVISHFESRSAPKPSAISFIKPQGGAVAKQYFLSFSFFFFFLKHFFSVVLVFSSSKIKLRQWLQSAWSTTPKWAVFFF